MIPDLQAMNARLVAQFMQGVAPHFKPPRPLPALTKQHDFETTIKGVPVVVSYDTKWEPIDCVEEIVHSSTNVFVAGTDITQALANEVVNGLRHEIEADWERIGEESKEDYQ